ncbi:MAG: radical SAM protein [Verrucomicrobiota bacterium]
MRLPVPSYHSANAIAQSVAPIRAASHSNLKIRVGPDGVHLFNRRHGINILADEILLPPTEWSKAPRQVSIALTNTCDLSCPFCFTSKMPATLPLNQLLDWLRELDRNGCLGVGFGGGEPTLYRQLPDLCRQTTHATGLAVTLTTHGHHLDYDLIRALTGNVHFVRVSMDGVGQTYEALRGRPFAELCSKLQYLRDLAPFGINFLVNSRTVSDLDAATDLSAKIGASEFLLLPEFPTATTSGIDPGTATALQNWIQRYRGPLVLTVAEAGADGLPTCNPLPEETGLNAYAHIDATGTLKRTSFDGHGVTIRAVGIMHALSELQELTSTKETL